MGKRNLMLEKWGFGVNMTECHITRGKKIGLTKHTHEPPQYSDRVVLSGKKWKVRHITL